MSPYDYQKNSAYLHVCHGYGMALKNDMQPQIAGPSLHG